MSKLASPLESVVPGGGEDGDSVAEDLMSTDSVFWHDDHHQRNGYMLPANHFRPIPELGFDVSRSPAKEDDAMISVSFSS
jgi:hypothetical protein